MLAFDGSSWLLACTCGEWTLWIFCAFKELALQVAADAELLLGSGQDKGMSKSP